MISVLGYYWKVVILKLLRPHDPIKIAANIINTHFLFFMRALREIKSSILSGCHFAVMSPLEMPCVAWNAGIYQYNPQIRPRWCEKSGKFIRKCDRRSIRFTTLYWRNLEMEDFYLHLFYRNFHTALIDQSSYQFDILKYGTNNLPWNFCDADVA